MPHSYSFIDDVGRGLVTLGANDIALGQTWHIPAAEPLTGQQLLDGIFVAAGIRGKV